ncbi:MAG: tRNA pseudouridine(55) synthase TruB [Armatimonadota bacterium]|nr:tRNA pseudouridine(55) synthase TruB [bacterium]MDW8321552.1 tRNA pseudouridine(55) synthase TruB [Armatimonadota bacterium]
MDALLNLYKPAGMTSREAVDAVRRLLGVRKAGHTGTLDPSAEGVLLICLGKATRLNEFLQWLPKTYRARMVLGVQTSTQDMEGEVIATTDASSVTQQMLEAVLPRFTGEIEQVPPMHSALHYEGKRLYDLAREGKVVPREARKVFVHRLQLLRFFSDEHPEADIEVECSTGTYIRTLCADIGDALGVGGYMKSLVRTSIGDFRIERAVTLQQLQQNDAPDYLIPMARAVENVLPVWTPHPRVLRLFRLGRFVKPTPFPPVPLPDDKPPYIAVLDSTGELFAIAAVRRDEVWPYKVFGERVLYHPRSVEEDLG